MKPRAMKVPGPDHQITIESNPLRVVVSVGGRTVADTTEALTLRETGYAAVQYIPRKNVRCGRWEWKSQVNIRLRFGGHTCSTVEELPNATAWP